MQALIGFLKQESMAQERAGTREHDYDMWNLRAHTFFENLLQKFHIFHQSPMHPPITVQLVCMALPRKPNSINEFYFKGRGNFGP